MSTYPADVRRGAHGAGLFAREALAGGTVVARFDGPVMAPDAVPADEVCYALVLDAQRWLVPRTDARYANHACDPNCYVGDDGEVVTLRAVARDDELTFDYARVDAAEYFADPAAHAWDPRWTFACGCGSVLCRGTIDGYTVVGAAREIAQPACVEVRALPGKGRGLVATRALAAGTLIETAPVLVIPGVQWPLVETSVLYDYTFEWGEDHADAAVALGLGSLINHASRPNATFERRYADGVIDFVTLRDVAAGEEITVDYRGGPAEAAALWFEPLE